MDIIDSQCDGTHVFIVGEGTVGVVEECIELNTGYHGAHSLIEYFVKSDVPTLFKVYAARSREAVDAGDWRYIESIEVTADDIADADKQGGVHCGGWNAYAFVKVCNNTQGANIVIEIIAGRP